MFPLFFLFLFFLGTPLKDHSQRRSGRNKEGGKSLSYAEPPSDFSEDDDEKDKDKSKDKGDGGGSGGGSSGDEDSTDAFEVCYR